MIKDMFKIFSGDEKAGPASTPDSPKHDADQVSHLDMFNHFMYHVPPLIEKMNVLTRYIGNSTLNRHLNPLTACGLKIYSQNDEDGITFEILKRLELQKGVFAEFGVGNGTENNTLALVAAEWSGFWVGGENLVFDFNPAKAQKLNFHYQKEWIKKSNIVQLYHTGLKHIQKTECDLISIDLDGNDYYFVEELLNTGVTPKVFIVEYNGKFIPPIHFKIEYNDQHQWMKDDYFGASLMTFYELFKAHGYFLACCNITGINAFFIQDRFRDRFQDIPDDINALYAPPRYFLTGLDVAGHPSSFKTIETLFRKINSED